MTGNTLYILSMYLPVTSCKPYGKSIQQPQSHFHAL